METPGRTKIIMGFTGMDIRPVKSLGEEEVFEIKENSFPRSRSFEVSDALILNVVAGGSWIEGEVKGEVDWGEDHTWAVVRITDRTGCMVIDESGVHPK